MSIALAFFEKSTQKHTSLVVKNFSTKNTSDVELSKIETGCQAKVYIYPTSLTSSHVGRSAEAKHHSIVYLILIEAQKTNHVFFDGSILVQPGNRYIFFAYTRF
jgi:hypothetical protein